MGRPVHRPELKLSSEQQKLIFAILLTDGWLEMQKKGINPRIGLQQSVQNKELIEFFLNELRLFITKEPQEVGKTAPVNVKLSNQRSEKRYPQVTVRTVCHPEFLQFIEVFKGHGKSKKMPDFEYLIEMLDWFSFSIILMTDGSRKNQGQGMEIHLQSFSKEELDSFCLALYKKLGIMSWPAKDKRSSKDDRQLYNVVISGYSMGTIREKTSPYMLESFRDKIPRESLQKKRNIKDSPFWSWLNSQQN